MPEEVHRTVPAAPSSLPAEEPLETTVARVRQWLEGFIDADGTRHLGLIDMVAEMYQEAKMRRERRESFYRAVASGGVLAVFGVGMAWLKDHLKI